MKIQESAENYLEVILELSGELERVRSIDVANKLGFSKPSVSVAMKNFKAEGFIDVDGNGNITLLKKGRDIAERIYERHNTIAGMLIALGVDDKTAYEDACKIEHDISQQTFECLKKHLDRIKLSV